MATFVLAISGPSTDVMDVDVMETTNVADSSHSEIGDDVTVKEEKEDVTKKELDSDNMGDSMSF